MKYDWLPLAEDNYNRRWQASDAILIISVDIYSGIAHISMTIVILSTCLVSLLDTTDGRQ